MDKDMLVAYLGQLAQKYGSLNFNIEVYKLEAAQTFKTMLEVQQQINKLSQVPPQPPVDVTPQPEGKPDVQSEPKP